MKPILLTVVVALISAAPIAVPSTAYAAGVVIQVGDRPYYRGPWYWGPHRVRSYWVAGHWSWRPFHRVWIHGHYVARRK